MKKLLSILLCLVMFAALLPVAAAEETNEQLPSDEGFGASDDWTEDSYDDSDDQTYIESTTHDEAPDESFDDAEFDEELYDFYETQGDESENLVELEGEGLYSEYSDYQTKVKAIEAKNPPRQTQLYRVDSNGDKESGICNVSAVTTLLNRRMAYDNRSGQFTVFNVFAANSCTNVVGPRTWNGSSAATGYEYTGGTGSWNSKKYVNDSGYAYQAKSISKSAIATNMSNLGIPYFNTYLATLLREHPEGVCLRNSTANHVAVISYYEIVNGTYQFYVCDPVNNYKGKLEGSWLYKKSNSDIYSGIDFIVYLSSSANVTPSKYTVTYNANGGSVSPTSKTVQYGSSYGSLPTPTRTGYNFNGWYTATSGGYQVTSTTMVSKAANHSLYARWTGKTYTVTFNANGGSVSQSSKTVTYGSTYGSLPVPTRTNYTFNGWYTSSSGGSQITASTTVTNSSNHTLYAQWTAKRYTVTFMDSDGSTVSTMTVTYGSTYGVLPSMTRTGYTFNGWFTASSGGSRVTESTTVTTASDHTLYAQWTPNTYTVGFVHCENDTSAYKYYTVSYGSPYGDEINSRPLSIRPANIFLGWYTEREGGTEITSETIVTTASDHTLYGHWRRAIVVSGSIDGKYKNDITGFGSFDLYINGERVANDATSCNFEIKIDETGSYELKDIRVCDGKSYDGFYYTNEGRTGSLDTGHNLELKFSTVHPKEWLDENNPEEYTYNGHKYLFFSEPVTWYEAKTISEYLGGHLLKIDNNAENVFINNSTDQAECWIGAMDETYGEEIYRNFVWIDDGTELNYKNWAAGQPDNDADNDEGSSNFVYMTPSGKWATAPGCTKHGFVCEIDQTAIPFDGTIEWNASDVQFKGTTPYVVYNGAAFTPRFTVKDKNRNVVSPSNYTYEYRENRKAGTGYVIVTFTGGYSGTARAWFKIYLPATTWTKVENVKDGILIQWTPVEGAAGYVIYRRAWSTTTNGWTRFERWWNVTGTSWIDGTDNHPVYAGTRYQYGVKAYFARRTDPVSGVEIGGNVNEPSGNYNLGEVGPLKTTVRISSRVLESVTAGSKQMTVKWTATKYFTGIRVQYAEDANFTKNCREDLVAFKLDANGNAVSPVPSEDVIKGLTSGKTYYVRVCSYHIFEGTTYYGEWSNVLSCKVK